MMLCFSLRRNKNSLSCQHGMTDSVPESTLGSEVTGPLDVPIRLRAPADCVDGHSTGQAATAFCCRNTNFGFFKMCVIL